MATKRLEAIIDASVKDKAVIDAANEKRSLSKHVEKLLDDYPSKKELPFVPKKEYES